MALFQRILSLRRRERVEREIEAELREHMAMCTDDNMARGMSRQEAERDSRRRFGSPVAMREQVAEQDAALWLESLLHDVRGALRIFFRSSGFALVVVATLMLGIGANTAIFQLFDALRFRALPLARPGELAVLHVAGGTGTVGVNSGGQFTDFTHPMWEEVKKRHDPFSGVFAWRTNALHVGPDNEQLANALEVSGNFFSVLEVHPVQGRLIGPQDESCNPTSVVVSYSFWKSEMAGEPITANTKIMVETQPMHVVGVTPASFFGIVVGDRFDFAYPTCTPPNTRREVFAYTVMGRLRPGWNLQRASEYLNWLSPSLFAATAPTSYTAEVVRQWNAFRLAAYPAATGVSYLREQYDSSLEILLAIAGMVLLIACANLANLMLARASGKRREVALRISLGATRGRLLRQILLESAVLAACGAALGVALAQPLSQVLVSSLNTSQNTIQSILRGSSQSTSLNIVPDWRVLLFAAGVTIATCLVFSTLPALRSTGTAPLAALKSGERGVVGNRERFSAQRVLVIAQVAVSMVLLAGALLFVKSYRNLLTLNPGMRENNITIANISFPPNVKTETLVDYKRQLISEVRAIPGVENATDTTTIPLTGDDWEHQVDVGAVGGSSKFNYVSPTFFATMGIPLLRGRNFTDSDTNNTPLVLIVNRAFLRHYVSGPSPLGVQVRVRPEPSFPARTYQIVGVVPDTKYSDLREAPPPQAFVPAAQIPMMAQTPGMSILIASRNPVATQSAVRSMVKREHPGTDMQFLDFQRSILDGLVGDRLMARLAGFFGLLAAVLVVVGLHGVLSYFVAQCRSEIGIRMALGATRARVVAMMLRNSCLMLGIGLMAGTALALLTGRGARTLLFGLKPWDPMSLAGTAVLLALVTVIASLIPSLRAANVNPIDSLRAE